ncbi:MAG TPA: hypothetical protein ENO18_07100, partial [Caldithrix sp.]|nr:hypothetical protein [Caldithrix sp.]
MRFVFFLYLILLKILTAQPDEVFNEKQFFQDLKQSYYNLNDTNLKNLTVFITNVQLENFAEEMWKNKEIFPLQLIWFKPDKLYLAQQGTPVITENKTKE